MKAFVYGRKDQVGLSALRAGLPYQIEWREHKAPFSLDADLVLIEGVRSLNRQVCEFYRGKLPVLIAEYGYLNRVSRREEHADKYWQVSIDRLGWCPSDPCPSDRFDALGLKVAPWQSAGDKPTLVCGDHPGLPSMGADFIWSEVRAWAESVVAQLKKVTSRPVYWRPHPVAPVGIAGIDGFSQGAVDWSQFHAVVCHNSTVGVEALLAGVPVFSDGDTALAQVTGSDLSQIENPWPWDRSEYFNRLAYGQWTLKEMQSGDPVAFYREKGYIT